MDSNTASVPVDCLFCLMRHLAAFHRQDVKKEAADFAEPCVDCPKASTCRFDWLETTGPAWDATGINVQLCYPIEEES